MEDLAAPNGSGQRGKGYGWQLDPSEWKTPKLDEGGKVIERSLTFEKIQKRTSRFDEKQVVQDFNELRDFHLANGTLFEDPDFPCEDSSVNTGTLYEWARPHELCDDPQFFTESVSRFDLIQGKLGNCWFVASVANLTLHKRLFFQVVPEDQSFTQKYAGIFHFRFWRYGRWIDVVVDDRLPNFLGKLVFVRSSERNIFWSALLEKAYAKVNGSYKALISGFANEAMADFTGGITERFEIKDNPNLFKIILKSYERSSLMGCSTEGDVLEEETPEGLVSCHNYSITRVKYVDTISGKFSLLRLRNPWGRKEWNGPWSDNSEEWHLIPEHEKEKLGLTFDNDGEFWMSFEDFQKHFDNVEICHLSPESLEYEEVQEDNKRWVISSFEGEWVPDISAGGCSNYSDTYPTNPQYRIKLAEADEDDDDGKCTLVVSLLQKNKRSEKEEGENYVPIGFHIYHLPDCESVPEPLDSNFLLYNAAVAGVPTFSNLREISYRYKLLPGTYCILAATFFPNEHRKFLLRVFSEHQNNV